MKEALLDLINIGVVTKGSERGVFRDKLVINTAGTTEWTKFVKEMENVELTRTSLQAVPEDLSAMGSQDQKFHRHCFLVRNLRAHGETVEGKPNTCKTTKQVDRLARARTKPSLTRTKARTRTKERVNTTARKGRTHFTKWCTTTRKTHEPVKITQNGQTGVGITLTTGQTQTGGPATGAQICGLTLHGNKRHDGCHRRNLLKNSPIQRTEAAFQW